MTRSTAKRATPKLEYVKFTRAKGKLYAYFNTGKKVRGKLIYAAMPEFGSAAFYSVYGAMKGARTKRAQVILTVADICARYEASDEFKELAAGTRKVYRLTLSKISRIMGHAPVDEVKRKHVYAVVEAMPGAASRNLFVAVVGVIYRWARKRDLTEAEPTKDIGHWKTGEYAPWPKPLLDAALACDDDRVRLAVHLLFYTGQRLGDVVKMRWNAIHAGKIAVVQQKTGKPLNIPLAKQLRAELDRAPRNGLTILTGPTGKPMRDDAVREQLKAYAAGLGHKVVPHGLRKNAVNTLLELGCTIPQVQAITGQSVETVMHYAKGVDQDALGEAAILKMERR